MDAPLPKNRDAVQAANFRVYEGIAHFYDEVDSRRKGQKTHRWIDPLLVELKDRAPGPVFLDLGAGSGFLTRKAAAHFQEVFALDLSPAMLARIQGARIRPLLGSCEAVPLPESSVHVAAAFATLHHLFDPVETFREAWRVLSPGGLLFTDHDIEAAFVGRFSVPLRFYRSLFDHGHEYERSGRGLREGDYATSEFHGDHGLDGPSLVSALEEIGFRDVRAEYHWQGLLPITFPWRVRGFSPLLRLWATKPK